MFSLSAKSLFVFWTPQCHLPAAGHGMTKVCAIKRRIRKIEGLSGCKPRQDEAKQKRPGKPDLFEIHSLA
ncbi:hypothetical protein [Kordiimonas sp.]|uniref:hypothetical protein n=1 Tax=Kordiimonas sp. TaxID=1970157 RepID=UPI003B51B908